MERKKLADILKNGKSGNDLRSLFDNAVAAEEFGKPVPPGEYIARIANGEPFNSRENDTPGYKLMLEIIEGEHSGRKLWHDVWLTEKAIPMAKRDLLKLGVTDLAQLDQTLPPGIICRIKVAVRKNDGGDDYNAIKSFDVVRIEPPAPDVFAPATQVATA